MKKVIYTLILALSLGACTKKFEDANKNPYQISDESLKQDFNSIGAYFPTLLYQIFGYQVDENLVQDCYVRHMATPTPFVSGVNNTTYYITWNTYWAQIYNKVMSPSQQVIKLADDGGYTVFSSWAKLIRIFAMERLTAYHGPLIYSNYGSSASTVYYDSESDLYNRFFAQLDTIQTVFKANTTYTGLTNFDASYSGKIAKWIKVVNSLRLRLAIRISNVAPALAKTQGEKAISDDGGLITSVADNFNISLYGNELPLAVICFSWGDTRMDAGMESFLVGLKDNRISSFFQAATDATLYTDHPDWPYKGVRSGALLNSKDDRQSYSMINANFATVTSRRFFTAAEVDFCLAEAALKGWSGAGTAQTNYESGVKASFTDWGATGVDAYLADATSTPIDYNDPKATGDVNDFVSRSSVTVKWDETLTNEEKLEKIITQKWIDGFTNSIEVWCDHRRTGYPKLPYNYKNDSSSDWGIIAKDDFLRRMPFVSAEKTSNPLGVADAIKKLSTAKDEIGVRLWWDTGSNVF
jgi:hypothetical protein